MTTRLGRRTFLRRAGAAALAPHALWAAGCDAAGGTPGGDAPTGRTLDTNLRVVAWRGDALLLEAPVAGPPMAYASRRERRIWIDRDHRDRVYWILRAHISTSTGLWRIPLLSDPPGTWVQPDDEQREFEEYEIADFDPGIEPAEGDFRVVTGRAVRAQVELSCEPLESGGWVTAGPIELVRCEPGGEEGCREDLVRVGEASRFGASSCPGTGERVALWAWAAAERNA